MMMGETAAWRRSVARAGISAALSLVLLAGCGMAGNPQPPTLWLPASVKDLTATRAGDTLHLRWSMPKNTTDNVALKGDQRGQVCWEPAAAPGKPAFDPKACRTAGDGLFTPGKPADFTAKLPAELTSGTRAVAFYVELQNHAGKTAGPSNAAWMASGPAPAGVTDLHLDTRAEGVVLHWQAGPAEAGLTMRIHRTLVKTPGGAKTDPSTGMPPEAEQTLEVNLNRQDPGGAVDRDAILDHEWKYWVERVRKVTANGHALDVAGAPSEAVSIVAKDVFPPAVPAGLAIVADTQAKAMDLSWTPDADPDIDGYIVYRRDVTAGGTTERITPKMIVPPECSDAAVVVGHRYAYAVSAVDRDGNESQKSAEVEEEIPQ